ncbi:MAG TPA: lipopolysaccharide kinase InaA family protein [Victivallales bacterium]|nr:lipopolysaccharide kinase InaA family protein [Victivallales bacterium]
MRPEVNEEKKNECMGWVWHGLDPQGQQLLSSFTKNPDGVSKLIKTNSVRSVWSTGTYFIKYNHPVRKFDKLRFMLCPKAKSEYKSLQMLEQKGVESVQVLGWAKNKSQSILITKNLDRFTNARSFWFSKASSEAKLKKAFLSALAKFAELLIEKKIRHKDLHLGNLLFNPEMTKFAIVDAYGIGTKKSLSEADKFNIGQILGSLRGEINDKEASEFLIESKIVTDLYEAQLLWTKILQFEAKGIHKRWENQSCKIFSESKFCFMHKLKNETVLIRKSLTGESLANIEDISGREEIFHKIILPIQAAKRTWELCFITQANRIPGILPVAMKIQQDKAKVEKGHLFYNIDDVKSGKRIFTKEELIRRCSISRLPRRLTEQIVSQQPVSATSE